MFNPKWTRYGYVVRQNRIPTEGLKLDVGTFVNVMAIRSTKQNPDRGIETGRSRRRSRRRIQVRQNRIPTEGLKPVQIPLPLKGGMVRQNRIPTEGLKPTPNAISDRDNEGSTKQNPDRGIET